MHYLLTSIWVALLLAVILFPRRSMQEEPSSFRSWRNGCKSRATTPSRDYSVDCCMEMLQENMNLNHHLLLQNSSSDMKYCDNSLNSMQSNTCTMQFKRSNSFDEVTGWISNRGKSARAAVIIRTLSARKYCNEKRRKPARRGTRSASKSCRRNKVKNFHKHQVGDEYLFGDDAPLVIVKEWPEHEWKSSIKLRIQLPNPLQYLEKSRRLRQVIPVCTYFDVSNETWDSSACNTSKESETVTVCSCQHNSAFTVIFSLTTIDVDDGLIIASTVLQIMSAAVLVVTTALLIHYRRKTRDFDRVLVQISLCISVAMAHVFLLLSEVAISNDAFCRAVIILSHYFLVTSAIAMVMEGGLILIRVTFPNSQGWSHGYRRRVNGFVVGWIIPMIYVALCAGFGIHNGSYGNYVAEANRFEVCWITDSFNLVVIIPVAIAIGINALILTRLGMIIVTLSRKAEEFKPTHRRDRNSVIHVGRAFRAVLVLLPILGIPWIVGFLINVGHPADEIFASIHVVINSCQGIFISLHYVVFNADMRGLVKRSWESAASEITSGNQRFVLNNKDSRAVGATDQPANVQSAT